ncbi:MAG: hypothetical protein Q8Q92_02915, partial [bacterium]|nr:hypothetical protein [bacterium]
NHWLEPARQFILAAQQAKIIALQENPVVGRDFLKRIGSNRVLLSQEVALEPKKSWQILYNLPAEARSAEASNSFCPTWLALLNDFRTFDWAEEYKYPTVVLDQMKGLLAKYENL